MERQRLFEYLCLATSFLIFLELLSISGAITYYALIHFLVPIGRNYILPAGGTEWQFLLVQKLYMALPIVTVFTVFALFGVWYFVRKGEDWHVFVGAYYAINLLMMLIILVVLAGAYVFGYIIGLVLVALGYYNRLYAMALDAVAILLFLVGVSWLMAIAIKELAGEYLEIPKGNKSNE